ncbi:ATP-binding cassette subfamily C protein [Neorhizobium sp. 2083]|uniref:type I secretion system permease/ATPase n=1 Tax=Neorhizobium sp. 2083 TaxID=2817762 RepID=UPI00285785C4|nr:type I secretion system permease/ATPase [Neorhizobium sp. 2083]MDR6820007.1 ATP-binding cassette subfamily C protein [Neorhizobium sp. 2083]
MFGFFQQAPSQLKAATVVPASRLAVIGIAVISGVVNVLALTSPLFMLQVYDRVLSSGSVPTLIGLAVLAAGLFAIQCLLDVTRAKVLLRIGELLDRQLALRVHNAVVRLPLLTRMPGDGLQPLRDLDNTRGFLSSQGPTAFFDLPWMPLYLGICFMFHGWIGTTALLGSLILIALTLVTNALSQGPARESVLHNMSRNAQMEAARRNAEVIQAMGLGPRMALRWQATNSAYLQVNRRAGDVAAVLGGISRSMRLVIQSAMLGVGAWLVIRQEVSAGVMIASSIMMGRALAPVDLAISSWKPFLMARQSFGRLNALLDKMPADKPVMLLPKPTRELRVENATIVPPGEKRASVVGVQFAVGAGSALGIIGPSGSGKSSLSRILVGAWSPAVGKVRIDGASLDQWDCEALGHHVGYLPQGVELFDGTIAQNIARFEDGADPDAIVNAARTAGAHELILRFDRGYETPIGEGGSALSAGQRQRIGLARALYRDPFLVVLDEPNANLDTEGEIAVVKAIASVRDRKGIAVIVAHRPSAIAACDLVLMMDGGQMKAFGPRDDILARVLKAEPARSVMPQGFSLTGQGVVPLRVVANQKQTGSPDAAAPNETRSEEPDATN